MQAKKRDSIEKADLPTMTQIMHKEIDSLYKLSKASISSLFTSTMVGISLRTSNSSATYLRDFVTFANQFMKVRHVLLLSEVDDSVSSYLINLKSFGSSKEKTADEDIRRQFEMLWSFENQVICQTERAENYQSFTRQFDELLFTPHQRVYSVSIDLSSIPGEHRKIIGLFFIDESDYSDCGDDIWELYAY